jgi:hypothetical protein
MPVIAKENPPEYNKSRFKILLQLKFLYSPIIKLAIIVPNKVEPRAAVPISISFTPILDSLGNSSLVIFLLIFSSLLIFLFVLISPFSFVFSSFIIDENFVSLFIFDDFPDGLHSLELPKELITLTSFVKGSVYIT